MKDSLLEIDNISVKAGSFYLRNISFSINTNEYVMILGPTGSGKTMLLECIAGLRPIESGEIYLNGKNITNLPPEQRHFGFAYQDSLLYPFLTIRENILFGARARDMAVKAELQKHMHLIADIMGISHLLERYPKYLSGGERQRVSLARAILTKPSLLLLDEPLSALDPGTRQSMQNLLREIHITESLGIIHVTHDFSEAMQLGTRMIVLRNGGIEQEGVPLDVFFRPASVSVAKFLQVENLIAGTLKAKDNLTWFKPQNSEVLIGPLSKVIAPDLITDRNVMLMIRSSSLSLHQPGESPVGYISWAAKVEYLFFNRTHVDVHCKGYGYWETSISIAHWQHLKLSKGDQVLLAVKPESCHLIAC
jgi:molybdate transport system ATP-binding protein